MTAHVTARGACTIAIANETMTLCPGRAMWWARRKTLVVADLHLGKEETFLSFGVPMPANVLDETLARLDALIIAHGAERVVVVGDLVHAQRGLTTKIIDRVCAWRERYAGDVELVIGNHDLKAKIPTAWRVTIRDERELDAPFRYRHEPPSTRDDAYVLSGHLHPMIRLEGRIDRLLLPCFAICEHYAVLPAFTAFSRGLRMNGEHGRMFAIAAGEVREVQESRS